MTLNHQIFNQTVDAAKTAAAASTSWIRAIEKAAKQIGSNPCITELSNGVMITSPSGRTYLANGVCQCEAFKHGKPCWHRAAAQLICRYNETINNPIARRKAERAALIADIKATWVRKYSLQSLADALMARFRCNRLEMLSDDFLKRIREAL
jgi:hypothetical protein